MRSPNRIELIFSKLDLTNFLDYINKDSKPKIFTQKEIKFCLSEFNKNVDKLKSDWLDCPDLRLTQLLVNSGLLPNKPGGWYYVEEVDYCIENKILKPREIYFWGTFGKDGKNKLKFVAIKNMAISHIKACLKTQPGMNPVYKKTMESELKLREKNKKTKSTLYNKK